MIYTKILRRYSRVWIGDKSQNKLQTGFSMLEAVVVVGVLLAIGVGGLFSYGPIVQNAKLAKVKSAASEVYTAATVAQIDGDPSTKPQDVIDTFNSSNDEIKVEILKTTPTAPAMSTAGAVLQDNEDLCIKATNQKNNSITAKAGACAEAANAGGSTPTAEVTPPAVDPGPKDTAIYSEILKNGDFAAGLTYWDKVNGNISVSSGQAYFNQTGGISQTIHIPSVGITGLKYDYRADGVSYQYSGATLNVKVYSPSGALLKTIKSHGAGSYYYVLPWTTVTVSLTEFAGQDIKLAFEVQQLNSTAKNMYVDNISVQTTTTAPNAPTNVQTSVNDTDVTVSWTSPNSGVNLLTVYTITPYRNGSPLPVLKALGGPPATSVIFKGLSSGGSYTFKVTATNSIGESPLSLPSTAIDRGLQTLQNGDFSTGLTNWHSVNGALPAVSSGQVYFNNTGSTIGISQTISVPSAGITWLQYDFRMMPASYQYAGATLNVKAYSPSGNLLKTVKSNGGGSYDSTIPQTTVTADLTEFAGQDIKLAFEVLEKDSYYNKPVFIDNISVGTTTSVSSAPTNVQTSVTDTDATITWTAPTSGAQSITSYTITPYRNGTPLPVLKTLGAPPAKSVVFKGLTSGGSYTFRVTATNSIGESAASNPSNAIDRATQTLKNGDFSSGLSSWYTINGATPTVSSGQVYFNQQAGISQTISIPSTGSTSLQYDYRIYSASYQYAGSTLYVKAYNPAGTLIATIDTRGANYYTAIPQTTVSVNLTQFAGQDIKLAFEVRQLSTIENKTILIDNVAVQTK